MAETADRKILPLIVTAREDEELHVVDDTYDDSCHAEALEE